jgi:hypothetical protein
MIAAKALPQFVHDLLASPPRAGQGVNLYLYQLARVLHPYRSEAEIYEILRRATAGCGRIVTEKEILRAIENSKQAAWTPGSSLSPAGHSARRPWPRLNEEQHEAILSEGYGLVDLWEESPIRFEDNEPHTEDIIDLLFPGNPLLCTGKIINRHPTRRREKWRGKLAGRQFIVPSPMSSRTGLTREGKVSQRSLDNTGSRRFLVVELDSGSIDDHAAILRHLREHAPLALAVHSGGKSLHGWFFCHGRPEERLRRFMRYAVSLGADLATWQRHQFVRMPGGTRDNGKRQTVYFLDPDAIKP